MRLASFYNTKIRLYSYTHPQNDFMKNLTAQRNRTEHEQILRKFIVLSKSIKITQTVDFRGFTVNSIQKVHSRFFLFCSILSGKIFKLDCVRISQMKCSI